MTTETKQEFSNDNTSNNNTVNTTNQNDIHDIWTMYDENILREITDHAYCYNWMHSECGKIYNNRYIIITLILSVLSGLIGMASFSQNQIEDIELRNKISIGFGGVSVLLSIVQSFDKLFNITQYRETFKMTANHWDKLNRTIRLELAKNRVDRTSKKIFIAMISKEYDKLIESSPIVSTDVISDFNKTFKDTKGLLKPAVCNIFTEPIINRSSINQYIEKITPFNIDTKDSTDILVNVPDNLLITEKFKKQYGREPTKDEINNIIELDKLN